jgi:HD-like signal output (HDOD) protein
MNIGSVFDGSAVQKGRGGGIPNGCTMENRLSRAVSSEGSAARCAAPEKAYSRHFLLVRANMSVCRKVESDLEELEPGWGIHNATNLASATAALESTSFDAFVMDVEVPEALQLLQAAERLQPRALRVVIASHETSADTPALKTAGVKVLRNENDAASLIDGLRALLQVRDWMADSFIAKLLARIKKLPTLPRLHSQVTAELQSPDGSLETVAEHVGQDPVMAAKFLQIVNSACFARACPVNDPREAVMFLGAEKTRALILMAGVFSQFDGTVVPGLSPEQLWDHSLRVGSLARGITLVETEDPKLAELAYTAGLLHDVGKLVLAANVPAMCLTVQQLQQNKEIPMHEAEANVFGTTHGELGACLLGSWALPYPLLEAVAWHHRPALSARKGFSVLAAVHAANVIALQTGHGSGKTALPTYFDSQFLEQTGLSQRLGVWREACGIASNSSSPGTK